MVFTDLVSPAGDEKILLSVRGFRTLDERDGYDVCPVCYWGDVARTIMTQMMSVAAQMAISSLTQARLSFASFGACEMRSLKNVRKPNESEIERQS